MAITETYAGSNERSITSYNYTDIANGLGVFIFYAALTEKSSGVGYILTQNTLPSAGIAMLRGAEAEHDFDLTAFNTSKTISGVATVSGTIYSVDGTPYCKFQLKKLSGTTETDISSQIQTQQLVAGTDEQILVELPLTKTVFKAGDILRLTIDFDGTNGNQGIGIDPAGIVVGPDANVL